MYKVLSLEVIKGLLEEWMVGHSLGIAWFHCARAWQAGGHRGACGLGALYPNHQEDKEHEDIVNKRRARTPRWDQMIQSELMYLCLTGGVEITDWYLMMFTLLL